MSIRMNRQLPVSRSHKPSLGNEFHLQMSMIAFLFMEGVTMYVYGGFRDSYQHL